MGNLTIPIRAMISIWNLAIHVCGEKQIMSQNISKLIRDKNCSKTIVTTG